MLFLNVSRKKKLFLLTFFISIALSSINVNSELNWAGGSILITESQITDLQDYLIKTGGTMTGDLISGSNNWSTTNVGIGTLSPNYNLVVGEDIGFGGNLIDTDATNADFTISGTNTGRFFRIRTSSTRTILNFHNELLMGEDTSADFFIDNFGGFIGMGGITSPTHTLNVEGDGNFTDDLFWGDDGIGGGDLTIGNILEVQGSTIQQGGLRYSVFLKDKRAITLEGGGGIQFGGKYTTAGAFTGFSGVWGKKKNVNSGDYGGELVFVTRTTGVPSMIEAMRIDSVQNVGIGTTSPTHKLNVIGDVNITENATFEKDVIIDGILYGGSPVKIAGINISKNVFFLEEDLNSSSRFTLRNINKGSNASAVISAVNDVEGSMFIGIGSSNFMLGSMDSSNVTALFSKARGNMFFANFFKQAFVWFYNPSDDNDPNNLVELMRLNESGLGLIGNLTAENVFLLADISTHTNSTIPVASAGVFYNVTFDEEAASPVKDITHIYNDETNDTFTIVHDGIYEIRYTVTIADSNPTPGTHVVVRLIKNGEEIPGSLLEEDSTKQYAEFTIGNGPHVSLVTGDRIKLQFTASATTVNMLNHLTYGEHKDSATMKIKRIR